MSTDNADCLYFATGNTSKFKEYHDLLDIAQLKWVSFTIPQEAESDITVLAKAKLQYVKAEIDKFPFFVEECGLSIPAWDDLPGALSSLFLNKLGCGRFCRMMRDFKGDERAASVTMVIHYLKSPRARVMTFSGQIWGTIATEPKGDGGHGWDQIFVPTIPAGNTLTMAELGREKKNQLFGTRDPVCAFRDYLRAQMPRPRSTEREGGHQSPAASKRTILLVTSNPKDTGRIQLDVEVKRIKQGLERARLRDRFSIVDQRAVTVRELRRALLDNEPEIVHFAGHGTGKGQGGPDRDFSPAGGSDAGGLILEDDSGHLQIVSKDALARTFKMCAEHVKCVVLNACYSDEQAETIAQHIDNVVGMKEAIGDLAAIKFAEGFYDALWAGHNVESAYEWGRNAIESEGLPDSLTPVHRQRPKRG
jgi:non-canonical purine NTP pyrophosphatase (RdgB/HAM1 family)